MKEPKEKRITQVSTDEDGPVNTRTSRRRGKGAMWIEADSPSNIIFILSIIMLLLATLITDMIKYILKPCLIWIIIDS